MLRTRRSNLLVAVLAALAVVVPAEAASAAPERPAAVSAISGKHLKRFSNSPTPKIRGALEVGERLTVLPGTWRPGRVRLSIQWYVDGVAVRGETGRGYTVRTRDAGDRIKVTVRGSKHGYKSETERSTTKRIAEIEVPDAVEDAVDDVPDTPAPAVTTPAVPAAPVITTAAAIAGDGKYTVGSAVQPGLYVTSGATDSCYWERVTSFDGQFSSIIANDIGSGQRIMRVLPSDYGVRYSRCGSWIPAANAPSVSQITTGQYLVGQQISAGTYQSTSASSGCYWETLSDFDGKFASMIDNDYNDYAGVSTVTIPSNAAGFRSNRCGVWTKVS